MELRTNCKNCGASLHYDETDYGKKVRCQYCRQEYHIDTLGRIEEYKVKLEFMEHIIDFYINSIEVQPDYIECTTLGGSSYAKVRTGMDINLELTGRL